MDLRKSCPTKLPQDPSLSQRSSRPSTSFDLRHSCDFMSARDFVTYQKYPIVGTELPGYKLNDFNADVDSKLSLRFTKSSLGKDKSGTFMQHTIRRKQLIPGPSQYHKEPKREDKMKELYKFDRVTSTQAFILEAQKLREVGPSSYSPEPLRVKPNCCKVNVHLINKARRCFISDNQVAASLHVPAPNKYKMPSLVSSTQFDLQSGFDFAAKCSHEDPKARIFPKFATLDQQVERKGPF